MRFNFRPVNRVVIAILAASALFALLVAFIPTPRLIVILNGIFAGTMGAVFVAYWRLLWNAVLGIRPYDRVRQMTLGFALCWTAYVLGVMVSIYLRSAGAEINTSVLTAASRYVAIIAAMLQVSAPDFGLGLFHGRDRKVLPASVGVGLLVVVFIMLAQTETVLAEQSALSF